MPTTRSLCVYQHSLIHSFFNSLFVFGSMCAVCVCDVLEQIKGKCLLSFHFAEFTNLLTKDHVNLFISLVLPRVHMKLLTNNEYTR